LSQTTTLSYFFPFLVAFEVTVNRQGVRRVLYRFNDPGYTLGGPVYIPKLLPHKDKLFFWSQEFQRQIECAPKTCAR
jgi:hypothetical protein